MGAEFQVLQTIAGSLTVTLALVIAILAISRGVVVTSRQYDAVLREKDAQLAELRAQAAALTAIYAAATDYAQRRGDTLHAEKEALLRQLDANSQQMFRAVDALGELREAVRDLTKARRAG